MSLLQFLFVPAVLFMVFVAPIWIVLHYRSLSRSSRSLRQEDRESIEQMLETADELTDRIRVLESILDADYTDWRDQSTRRKSNKGVDYEHERSS